MQLDFIDSKGPCIQCLIARWKLAFSTGQLDQYWCCWGRVRWVVDRIWCIWSDPQWHMTTERNWIAKSESEPCSECLSSSTFKSVPIAVSYIFLQLCMHNMSTKLIDNFEILFYCGSSRGNHKLIIIEVFACDVWFMHITAGGSTTEYLSFGSSEDFHLIWKHACMTQHIPHSDTEESDTTVHNVFTMELHKFSITKH